MLEDLEGLVTVIPWVVTPIAVTFAIWAFIDRPSWPDIKNAIYGILCALALVFVWVAFNILTGAKWWWESLFVLLVLSVLAYNMISRKIPTPDRAA